MAFENFMEVQGRATEAVHRAQWNKLESTMQASYQKLVPIGKDASGNDLFVLRKIQQTDFVNLQEYAARWMRDATSGLGISSTAVAGLPTVVSRTVLNANTIRVVFTRPMYGSLTGWSSRKATVNNPLTGFVGNGSVQWDITVTNAILTGNAIDISYDAAVGQTVDINNNEIATFLNQVVVNNL